MELVRDVLPWDGGCLNDLIGLAWPDPAQPGGAFAAAGGGRVVLVAGDRLTDFLSAHPQACFVADIGRPHGFDVTDGAVDRLVVESRLYDIGLLSELVRLAAPGVTRPPPDRPAGPGWAGYSESLRADAARLLAHAEGAAARIGADPLCGTRFGPFGIGLDVRRALAAARGGPGLRLTEAGRRQVIAVLAERERVARTELKSVPAARSFANTRGGVGFLDRGDLGTDRGAIEAFVRGIIRGVRMRDRLPIPAPADLIHDPGDGVRFYS